MAALAGCTFRDDDVGGDGDGGGDAPVGGDGAAGDGAAPKDGPTADGDAGDDDAGSLVAPPALAGCADGTRDGFADLGIWRSIAACAGGWSFPGILSDEANTPHCGRAAGNASANPSGQGCSVADLCALGWHVCRGTDIAADSPTQCEGAAAEIPRFFAARLGASAGGVCTPGGGAANTNNVHGCGNLGARDDSSCAPADHMLGIPECAALGVWRCGGADDWQREADVVSKDGPTLGGVLCCHD